MPGMSPQFSPELFFDNVNGYYRTAAIKAGIEMEVFTKVGERGCDAPTLARQCQAPQRGIRILCDYLTTIGFLCKEQQRYFITKEMAMFLNKNSPGYIGGTIDFLLSDEVMSSFTNLTKTIQTGKTITSEQGALDPDHPQWVKFAKAMQPVMSLASMVLAERVDQERDKPLKVLDVACGHGLFGIAFAKQNPYVEVTAADWSNVLTVAKENAEIAGVSERMRYVPGDAFEQDLGEGYDIVLFANFLHHFSPSKCEEIIAKAHHCLKHDGRAVTFEFIANQDRISPPLASIFTMMMLGTTPEGDVYTFEEIKQMFSNCGFKNSELHSLSPVLEKAVISYK